MCLALLRPTNRVACAGCSPPDGIIGDHYTPACRCAGVGAGTARAGSVRQSISDVFPWGSAPRVTLGDVDAAGMHPSLPPPPLTVRLSPVRRNLIIVLPAAVLFLGAGAAAAETYHVAASGNDGAAGSEAAPWRTLQHAADSVTAGDIVRVHAGAYGNFEVTRSGRAGAEIAFVADSGVSINTDHPVRGTGINIEGASYIRIEGVTRRAC
jgi:hypothetical protein